MAQQLSLFDPAPSPAQKATDRLFLALLPEPTIAQAIYDFAQERRTREGMKGRPIAPDRLHVSLLHLGDFAGLPQELVQSSSERMSTLAATLPAFEVSFDVIGNFSRRPLRKPLVLLQDHQDAQLKNLAEKLLRTFGPPRSGGGSTKFNPHVTLLYDEMTVPLESIPPFVWQVNEIVLVHSLIGQSRYVILDRWALKG